MTENIFPNWFKATAIYSFTNHLFSQKNKPNQRYLQLGAYTGDASVWMLDNILDSSSVLIDIDTWKGSKEEQHEPIDFNKAFDYYKNRVNSYNNIKYYCTDTISFLKSDNSEYDFIYIDADHTAVSVIVDAELSWRLLKVGGIMAFDDYIWYPELGDSFYTPKIAIDMFLDRHAGEYEIMEKNVQVWIKKIS